MPPLPDKEIWAEIVAARKKGEPVGDLLNRFRRTMKPDIAHSQELHRLHVPEELLNEILTAEGADGKTILWGWSVLCDCLPGGYSDEAMAMKSHVGSLGAVEAAVAVVRGKTPESREGWDTWYSAAFVLNQLTSTSTTASRVAHSGAPSVLATFLSDASTPDPDFSDNEDTPEKFASTALNCLKNLAKWDHTHSILIEAGVVDVFQRYLHLLPKFDGN